MRIIRFISIVTVLAILVYVGYWYLTKKSRPPTNRQTNTTVIGNTTNTTTIQTPVIIKGDILVDKSVAYRDTILAIDTALKTDAFRRTKAPAGKEFVILFLKPFTVNPPIHPIAWAGREIRLDSTGGEPVGPREVSVPDQAEVAGGYLWFEVPANEQGFFLLLGIGQAVQTLRLGF
ncbi:MAG: hypothetical protein HY420_03685 [Candidatus Kerfeldbacteria bacterium]|nr:hypothetical protein [Candidatus Kerfeldbacteria bacterium]